MADPYLIIYLVTRVILAATLIALVHAAIQPAEAYTAAEKQTKTTWIVILVGSAVAGYFLSLMGAGIAAVAAGVYFVDVRPRLLEVQGKSR